MMTSSMMSVLVWNVGRPNIGEGSLGEQDIVTFFKILAHVQDELSKLLVLIQQIRTSMQQVLKVLQGAGVRWIETRCLDTEPDHIFSMPEPLKRQFEVLVRVVTRRIRGNGGPTMVGMLKALASHPCP